MKTCTKCGSNHVEAGTLGSAAIWLDKQSAWSRAMSGAQAKLVACLDCGHIELSASPEELRKLLE
jgi:hypothetical protein